MNALALSTPAHCTPHASPGCRRPRTISQNGDALTWLGLAVLAVALMIRVTAFMLLSLLAGVLAACRFGRMVVIGLMFLVTQVWPVCVLMPGLNTLTALQVGCPEVG